jgi:hypothetical protein
MVTYLDVKKKGRRFGERGRVIDVTNLNVLMFGSY